MSDDIFSNPPPASPPQRPNNLCSQIIQSMKREPGDEIRCVHIDGDKYRCNWWAPANRKDYDNPSMRGGQIGTTFHIRKSRFMRVTQSGTDLKIIELPQ